MTRQMIRRSGAAHKGGFAPLALSGKWWGTIGALGAVGAVAYLLPSFADGRRETGRHLPDMARVQPAPNNVEGAGRTPLSLYSPPAQKWQNLPLLALQSSNEVAADGEVRLLALQAAFERERNSAAAAQLQVVALQEQLTNLREKQEEVLVLREQLADAEAHAKLTVERSRLEIEQKKLAESARLKVVVLQEELATLSTEVLKARTAAESEKARAVSALEQLDAVQHQLVVATARESDRTELESRLLPENGRIVDEPLLNSPRDAYPVEQASKPPLPHGANTASPNEQGKLSSRTARPDKSEKATADKPRQALLNIGVKPPARPANKTAAAPVRTFEPDVSRLAKPRHEPRNQSVRSAGKPPQGAGRRPRLLAQDTHKLRDSGALSLPSDLLPDSRLW